MSIAILTKNLRFYGRIAFRLDSFCNFVSNKILKTPSTLFLKDYCPGQDNYGR